MESWDERSTRTIAGMLVAGTAVVLAMLGLDLAISNDDAPTSAGAPVAAAWPEPDVAQAGPIPGTTSFTVALTGEILPHPSVVEHAARFGAQRGAAYDFTGLFLDVSPVIATADLAICHLEVPVAPPGRALSGYPSFAIPAEVGVGIRNTGWDRCSTASNHSNDQGTAGISATLGALDAAGVGHSGMARTADEAAMTSITDVAGVPVAHLSYTWGFNGTPPAERWMVDVIDPAMIQADASAARAAGAAVVIVSLHWGSEYDTVGSTGQRSLASQLLASPDIDLIVGHGPHVLQPVEQFGEEYAFLSVGNLVANQGAARPGTYDGVIATVRFSLGADGRFHAAPPVVHPTWYDRDAGRVRLVNSALDDPGLLAIHDALDASVARTRDIIGPFVSDP